MSSKQRPFKFNTVQSWSKEQIRKSLANIEQVVKIMRRSMVLGNIEQDNSRREDSNFNLGKLTDLGLEVIGNVAT